MSTNSEKRYDWVLLHSSTQAAVSSLPFLKALLEQSSRGVVLVTRSENRPLYKLALERGLKPYADRVRILSFDFQWKRLPAWNAFLAHASSEFPAARAFCLDTGFVSAWLALRSGAPVRRGFSKSLFSLFYSEVVAVPVETGILTANRYLQLLEKSEAYRLIDNKEAGDSILSSGKPVPSEDLFCLSLRAEAASAAWPLENAEILIREALKEGVAIQLLGEASDHDRAQVLLKKLSSPLVYDFPASLEKEIEALEKARVLISNDSRDVILASDLGVPVLGLFGPTLPEFGNAPWRRNSRVLGVGNLSCRPCHFQPPPRCPKGHHKCLKDIEGKRVFGEAKIVARTSP